jgi:hypothetical protein
MRTVRSNDAPENSADYWKIFPDDVTNLFERSTMPFYQINAQLFIDGLPQQKDEDILAGWFAQKLCEDIEKDASCVRRAVTLSLSSQSSFYHSFWRSSLRAVYNVKSYISLAARITATLTALFTYLRLSQPTSVSADPLSLYVQENAANITARAFELVSAAMAANNLRLPTDFLNATLDRLTTEILNQSVIYLRQESQASQNTSLLNIAVLAMGMAAASLAIIDKFVAQREVVDKLDEERFTKLILPVRKCAKEIALELALKHSVAYRIANLLNESSPSSFPTHLSPALATVDKSKGKEEEETSLPVAKPNNNNDTETRLQMAVAHADDENLIKLVGSLLQEFDKARTLKGYSQAKSYLDLASKDAAFKNVTFNVLRSRLVSKLRGGENILSFSDLKQFTNIPSNRERINVVVGIFSSKEIYLAHGLFELLTTDQLDPTTLIQSICEWLSEENFDRLENAADKISTLTPESKAEFSRATQGLLNSNAVDADFIDECVILLLEDRYASPLHSNLVDL